MGLLIDVNQSGRPTEILTEAVIHNGVMTVSGVLQKAETPNANNRIYPYKVLAREVDKYKRKIEARTSHGELDHPNSSEIKLSNVSHIVTDIWWNGMDVMGRCQVLPTPAGNTLRALIESNVTVGISSRGNGTVSKQPGNRGAVIVNEDYDLICWDFVSTPSTPGAWMHLSESKVQDMMTKGDLLSQIIAIG